MITIINKILTELINKNPYFNYFVGYRCYKKAKIEEALQHTKMALASKPEYSPAIQLLMSIGIVLNNKLIIAQAFDLINKKSKQSQLDFLSLVSGLVHLDQHLYAEKYIKKIKKRKYKNDVMLIKANIAANEKQYKKALAIIEKIKKFENIKNPYILIQIAHYMIKLGNKKDALTYLNRAQEKGDNIVLNYIEELLNKYYKK